MGANRHQPPPGREAVEGARPEGRIANVFKDNIDTAVFGHLHHYLCQILLSVVHPKVCTKRTGHLDSLVRPSSSDHAGTHHPSHLHQATAQGASRAHDQHPLTCLELHLTCLAKGHREVTGDDRRSSEREPVRNGESITGRHDSVLRVTTPAVKANNAELTARCFVSSLTRRTAATTDHGKN